MFRGKKKKKAKSAKDSKKDDKKEKDPAKFEMEESSMPKQKKAERIGKRSVFKTWFKFLRFSKNLPLVIIFVFLMCTYNIVLMAWDLVLLSW